MGGWDKDYEILIVSEETEKAIQKFNTKRKESNM